MVYYGNREETGVKVFLIPSWYPSKREPLSGIFTHEQAIAIADICQDVEVVVSTWGHSDLAFKARKPSLWADTLLSRIKLKSNQINKIHGLYEVFNPALNWSYQIPFGGARRLLAANRKNFLLAMKTFGKPDIIHAHVCYPAGYIASVLSDEFNVPFVITEHMGPFPFKELLKNGKPINEIVTAFKKSSSVIAVSDSLADDIEFYNLAKSIVIPNMVDERFFKPAVPAKEKFIFFTLGGLTSQKGIEDLLYAIALWNPPASDVEFRIGGDGSEKNYYMKLAKSLKIDDRVKWLGTVSRDEAPVLFGECHAYIMPSKHESFGVVFVEAIASGKPVIATRCGGPESIVNKTNGLLVEVGDIQGLAESMSILMKNWHMYSSEKIRADFEKRFSRPVVAKKIVDVYHSQL